MSNSPSLVQQDSPEGPGAPAAAALDASARAPTFDELYDACFELVWRFAAFRGVRQAELRKAVREVFAVVRRQLPELSPAHAPRAWTAGIARDVIRGYLRSDENPFAAEGLLADELFAEGASEPIHELDRKTASELCDLILCKMSESEREAFCLFELEQLSKAETLEALGLDETTLEARLREARKVFNAMSARVRAQRFWISREGRRQP